MDIGLMTLVARRVALANKHLDEAIQVLDPWETGRNDKAVNLLREVQHELYMLKIPFTRG